MCHSYHWFFCLNVIEKDSSNHLSNYTSPLQMLSIVFLPDGCMRQIQRIRLMCGVTCFSDDLKEETKSLFRVPMQRRHSGRSCFQSIDLLVYQAAIQAFIMLQQWILTQKAQKDVGDNSLWVQASGPPSLNNRPRAAFDTAVLTLLSYCTLSTVICRMVSGSRGCK